MGRPVAPLLVLLALALTSVTAALPVVAEHPPPTQEDSGIEGPRVQLVLGHGAPALGTTVELWVLLRNPSEETLRLQVDVTANSTGPWRLAPATRTVEVPPRAMRVATFQLEVPREPGHGVRLAAIATHLEGSAGSGVYGRDEIGEPMQAEALIVHLATGGVDAAPGDEVEVRFVVENRASVPMPATFRLQFEENSAAVGERFVDPVPLDPPNATIPPGGTVTVTARFTVPEGIDTRFWYYARFLAVTPHGAGYSGVGVTVDNLWPQVKAWARDHPVTATTAGATATGGVTALGLLVLARRSENLRYLLTAPFAGLFTRLRKPQVLGHAMRDRIHAAVASDPGVTLTELKHLTGLGTGALVHHVQTLEKHRYIVSRREGTHRRFYPVGPRLPEVPVEAITPMQHRLLALLAEGPLTQGEIGERLGLTKQGVNNHVKALQRRGLLTLEERDGRWVCVTTPATSPPP